MDSLADYLKPLLPAIPLALVGAGARPQLLATTALLPAGFAFNTLGFECPLHDPSAQADFLVCAQSQRNGATALCLAPLADPLAAQPAWQSVRRLGKVLAQEKAPIDDIWLEFDLAGAAPTTPNLFLRPIYPDQHPEHMLAALIQHAPLLIGEPPPTALANALRNCIQALPQAAQVFQVGAMLARSTPGLRLCINEISLDGILTFLKAAAFPGDIAEIKSLLIEIQPVVGDVALNLDLSPDFQAKLGFECYCEPNRQRVAPQVLLGRFLEKLSTLGVSVPEKVEALLRYPGATEVSVAGDQWPPSAMLALSFSGSRRCVFQRSIHHLKLVYQPNQPLQAKAYLAIRQHWL